MNGRARTAWRHVRRLPGLGMWLVALTMTTVLFVRSERGLVLTGFAAEITTQVGPVVAGRLRDVPVTADQKVVAGQVVAWLDDTEPRLEAELAEAELRRLRQEVQRETASWHLDLESDRRRFIAEHDEARLAHLEARAVLAAASVQLAGLESNLERTRALAAAALASIATLEDDSIACQTQRELVQGQTELVAALAARQGEAAARLRQFADTVGAPAASALPAALAAAVEVQEATLQLAELARARCALRAPVAGVVGEILRRPGEAVAAGEPVVTLVEERALEVVAYVTEDRAADVVAGRPVTLRRAARPGWTAAARIASVAAGVTMVPERSDPGAPLPAWGRAVRVRLPEGCDARPGEAFRILF